MFHSGPLYLILLFQVVIACTYRQSVPVEVKIACILYVPMIISIYILCLDRIALKMQPNIVEAVTASHVGQLGFPWHFSLVSQTFYNRIIVFFCFRILNYSYLVWGVSWIGRTRPKFSKYAGKGVTVALKKLYALQMISGSVSLCVRALFETSLSAVLKPGLIW